MARSSSLAGLTTTAINVQINSKYDVVKTVADNIDSVVTVAGQDVPALITALNAAADFTGITVVPVATGVPSSWDTVTKTLYVETVQGPAGPTSYQTAIAAGYIGTEAEYVAWIDKIGTDVVTLTDVKAQVTILHDDTVINANSAASDAASANTAAVSASSSAASAAADATTASNAGASATADAAQTALDRIATNAGAVSTAADVLSTHADVVITNADSAQTALDKIATNADVITTAADVVKTNADATATALDKIATNADVVLTHADATATNLDKIATATDVVTTNADVVTTTASKNAASTSEINAAASATSAATDASTATTAATNAGISETNAATSATSALASKDAAAVSAANAATSETNSAASATSSSLSKTQLEALFLGSKTSDPTLDNAGQPLQIGAVYYNTTLVPAQLKIWDGTIWADAAFNISGAVTSVNGRTGAVVLTASDINTALGFTAVDLTKANVDALGIDAATISGNTVATSVPANAVFTDTIYNDTALNARVTANDAKVSNVTTDLSYVTATNTVTSSDGTDAVIAKVSGTNDGLMLSADKTKLDGVAAGATVDQTGAQIKALYEAELNTNAYTDAEKVLVSTALQSETTTAIALNVNSLDYTDETGVVNSIDLSKYLDNTTVTISSGVLDAVTGICTFTRSDATTFTVDLSALLDNTNLVTSVAGKAGVVTLVKADVGLGNVDNTTDLLKPISTATQTALDLKANSSQVLTNVPANAVFTDTVYDDTALAARVTVNDAKVGITTVQADAILANTAGITGTLLTGVAV